MLFCFVLFGGLTALRKTTSAVAIRYARNVVTAIFPFAVGGIVGLEVVHRGEEDDVHHNVHHNVPPKATSYIQLGLFLFYRLCQV